MKIIVTDLDGTLLTKDKKVSKLNCEVLNKVHREKGVELVIASGRDIYSIKEITGCLSVDYHICFNGAKVYKHGEVIYNRAMPEKICEDILKKGMEFGLEFSATAGKEIHYTRMDNEYTRLSEGKESLIFINIKSKEQIVGKKFEKMVFVGEHENFLKLRSYVEKNYSDDVNLFASGDDVIDIVSKECNKGNALKIVAQDLGIENKEIIAFGDNENDLSMLEIAGCPVIMANAKEEYKKEKYNKTLSNDEDGVGIFVQDYFKF